MRDLKLKKSRITLYVAHGVSSLRIPFNTEYKLARYVSDGTLCNVKADSS